MITGLLLLSYVFKLPILVHISLAVGLLASISSRAAAAIEWLWMKLAQGLGWVNSRILLSIVYFIFLLPLAIVRRSFQKESNWKYRKGSDSFFVERNHTYTGKDLINPW